MRPDGGADIEMIMRPRPAESSGHGSPESDVGVGLRGPRRTLRHKDPKGPERAIRILRRFRRGFGPEWIQPRIDTDEWADSAEETGVERRTKAEARGWKLEYRSQKPKAESQTVELGTGNQKPRTRN